ncbi:MAG: hypothetical protein NTX16_07305 [Actinobacteria bacterium]|nr:hypothetical protein [Actinomycetota bacterium]
MITVIADEFTDPAAAQDRVAAAAGDRLVSLHLTVAAAPGPDSSNAMVTLPMKESSFLLVAADDSLYTPAVVDAELREGRRKPASSTGFDVVFAVRYPAELVRFVCTPGGNVTPRSATLLLK